MSSKKMEKKERCEVPIHGMAKVSHGYYYDHETRHFLQAHDLEHVKTEKVFHFKFEIFKKHFFEISKTSKVLSNLRWAIDYEEEKPVDVFLIKGRKCLEERGLEVPEDSEKCRVLSVIYSNPVNLLLCFKEEIPGDDFNTFVGDLHSICSQSSYSVVLSKLLLDKFVCGYIYPKYSGPGKRFDKFMYGIKEFCSVLQEAIVSTIPISAIVEKQSSSYNNSNSVRFGDSGSDGFKTEIKSESNVDVLLKSKNTVGTMNSDNVAVVHSNRIIKQGGVGHGITKKSGVKGEIASTPGGSVGRGRGTAKGRGNSTGSSIQNKESTTRVGERRRKDSLTYSMDQELQDFCDNFSIELGNAAELSLDPECANVNKVAENMSDVSIEYLEQLDERKETGTVTSLTLVVPKVSSDAPNSPKSEILTNYCHQTRGLNSSWCNQPLYNESIVSHSDSSDVFRRDHVHASISDSSKQDIIQEKKFHQNNSAEQKESEVIHGEHCFSGSDPSICKGSLTMAVECNKTLQKDNINKSEKSTRKLENLKNEVISIQKTSFDESERDVQLLKNPTYSTLHSELQEGSNDKPAFNTRSGSVKKETQRANELPRGNIKNLECDHRKSKNTKEKDTTNSKMTEKENLRGTGALTHKCNSKISENAEKNRGHSKEVKKSKNAEKKADPIKYSKVETNNVHQKELFQGLMCNEDKDEKSFLKIGKQDNRKSKNCKEKPQMKSTFLEADKTIDDTLGFQRKYYGIVNDTSLEKVILLLGASGSGKTTLVNLAANYFKEKKSADEELYHVVATSPTSEITAYTFCSAPDEIPITIIDTPGLNDSSGAEVRDHIQALKTFLANASAREFQIHAIGFVAQAYLVRLTSSERLVMDYVSTIFGQGVKDHLITLVTFADNQDSPPVVEAMKNYGVSFKLSLKFNNSALHNNKAEEVDDIDRVYWRICWRNWKKCMKTLRDLSPLSVSTMKAVQSEVFASTILKSVERDLTASLNAFFTYSKEDRISSKEASKDCAEIWNLSAVLHHFRSVNKGLHISREDILIEIGAEICKAKQICAKENICFLSLSPETPLIVSGLQVIRTMASLYKQSKIWHSKSNTLSANVTEWTHCLICDKDHKMERQPRGMFKKLAGFDEYVVALKCKSCKCPGDVHGVSENKSPFHPDVVLEKTYTALQYLIGQYSFSNFPIPLEWYLKFLDQLFCFEHTDFLNEIWMLKK